MPKVVQQTRSSREPPVPSATTLTVRAFAQSGPTADEDAQCPRARSSVPFEPANEVTGRELGATTEELCLVTNALAGDQRALRQIYSAHQGQVRGHLHRLLGADSEIDDLVQTVFSRAFAALETFQGKATLSTWLYRITTNTTHNLIRQRYRRQRLELAVRWFGLSAVMDVSSSSSVDARDEARRVLEQLRPDLREVFVLYHYEGLTLHEIAEILERPVSTLGDQLNRARRRLRELARS